MLKDLVTSLRAVWETANDIGLHEPIFNGNEEKYLGEAIRSTYVSSVGPFVDRFEEDLAQYTGVKKAIAVVNGTAALHISLLLAGVERNDEVLLPALTFVATANAVSYTGAIPHFIDSEEDTLGVDPLHLRRYLEELVIFEGGQTINKKTKRRIKAIVPVHVFGHPCKIEEIIKVASDFGLEVVEDAAESLGSFYKDKHTGTFGLLGALSFNGNKIVTTGGGGAILTNDEELGQMAKHLTTTAKVPHRWEYVHDQLGYNYRMPNINAALGCAQLEQLESYLVFKRELFGKYKNALNGQKGVRLMQEGNSAKSNYWLQALVFDQKINKDDLLNLFHESGLGCRPAWKPLHKLPFLADSPKSSMLNTELLVDRVINLPSMQIN